MRNFFIFVIVFCFVPKIYSQIGGGNTFEFLNLNTSPRIIALGGYVISVIDGDINNGVYNPSLINSSMSNKASFNYTNYYTDIMYGDASYAFSLYNHNLISSIKFIDYGEFVETNEFGQEIGSFTAGEYVFSIGAGKPLLDSLFFFGLNTKLAYSSLYQLNSIGLLFDFAITYDHPKKNVTASILFQNIGYQIIPYYEGERQSMPFEIAIGLSNKLEHMPLRWHLTFQHIETPELGFENSNNSMATINNNFGYSILRHVVFGSELLIHKNASIFLGYNNRRRFEMIIEDRRVLVGFSCGFSFRINRFNFYYSRTSNHFSSPINSFGIVTNFNKN